MGSAHGAIRGDSLAQMYTDQPEGCPSIVLRTPRARIRRRASWWWIAFCVELIGVIASAVQAGGSVAAAGASHRWVWPLVPVPEIVGAFDPPDAPWLPGHRGVDLAGHPRQPVRAAGAGQVTFVGRIAGVAVVVIKHGALRTTYQPVDPAIDVGDTVMAGDVIGQLTRAGGHCLPETCLHWGLLRGDTYLDPLLLLGGGPVRLLPLSGSWSLPGTVLTYPGGPRPAPSIRSGIASARRPATVAPESVGGWTSQFDVPERSATSARQAAIPARDSTDRSWLWATGWLAFSAVGAGLSLRFSARWARRGS